MNRRPRHWLRGALTLVLLGAFLVVVLAFWLWSPTPEPDAATAEVLEAAAERWWRPDCESRMIPEEDWPPELRRLGPERVRVDGEGVYIQFGSFLVEGWGLFVLPKGSDFRPSSRGDPSYKLLRGRIYKYEAHG